MKYSAVRPPRAGWRVPWGVLALACGLCTPLLADEQSPQRQPDSQAQSTRSVAPRAAPTPSRGSTPQAPPTARDTRQIPPQQYRQPAPPAHRPPATGRRHGHGGVHFGYYFPYYRYPYLWRWGWWGPYWYGPPHWAYPGPYGVRYVASDLGGLDLNVKPKKAAVYVDGQYFGLARQFDGYPGYLWLEKGRYEVTLFMDGYKTVSHGFEIRPGQVMDVRIRMEPGEAIPPEELAAASQPASQASPGPPGAVAGPGSTEPVVGGQSDRVRHGDEAAASEETGSLQFRIEPQDASVYLDGRFLGSGSDLEALHAGLIVAAGRHTVEVVRPGYASQELNVFVEAGGELDLKVKLDEASS